MSSLIGLHHQVDGWIDFDHSAIGDQPCHTDLENVLSFTSVKLDCLFESNLGRIRHDGCSELCGATTVECWKIIGGIPPIHFSGWCGMPLLPCQFYRAGLCSNLVINWRPGNGDFTFILSLVIFPYFVPVIKTSWLTFTLPRKVRARNLEFAS